MSYERNLRLHVIPRIGALQLSALGPNHLNALYAELLRTGHQKTGSHLSPRTVAYIHAIIHRALKDAGRWEIIVRNPADFADPPRSSATRAPEMEVWSPDQLRTFLHYVSGHRLYAAYVLVATTGLRRGELAGLRWIDVDLEASSIAIRHTLISLDYKVEHSTPKTQRGRRSLALDQLTLAILRAHRARQLQEPLACGMEWNDTGFVFTQEDGSPYHPESISSAFERHSRQAGLPAIRFHDLRHSYATAALVAGVRPKIVSARLGHASIQITTPIRISCPRWTRTQLLLSPSSSSGNRRGQRLLVRLLAPGYPRPLMVRRVRGAGGGRS